MNLIFSIGFFFLICLFTLGLFYLLKYFLQYRSNQKLYTHFPHRFSQWFDPFGKLMSLNLVPTRWAPYRPTFTWTQNYKLYDKLQSPIFALISSSLYYVHTADPDIIHQITTTKRQYFPKPIERFEAIDLFGKNVVTTEGEDWKRHRKISQPSFAMKNNRLVHEVTVRSTLEMIENWNRRAATSSSSLIEGVEILVGYEMMKLALFVISAAGFGQELHWNDEEEQKIYPQGHTLSFREALEIVTHNTLTRIITPKWMFKWVPSKFLARIRLGFEEFDTYMKEMVAERSLGLEKIRGDKSGLSSGNDLLTSLLSALKQDQEGGHLYLSSEELYGNMFIFLLAGHETTAGTLEFALALCALHPEIQEKVYQEIITVIGDRTPEYDDFPNLLYPMYVMKETLRLFPPAVYIPRCAPINTTLQVPVKKDQEKGTLPSETSSSPSTVDNLKTLKIHAGTIIHIEIAALHRNPKFWPLPDQFYPQRFDPKSELQDSLFINQNPNKKYQKENSDALPYYRQAFIPFSDGARACLGRKFAEVEFVCAFSLIIQRFSIHLPSDVNKETFLDAQSILTLKPANPIHLIFRKRSKVNESIP